MTINPHVVSNLYDFLSLLEHKIYFDKKKKSHNGLEQHDDGLFIFWVTNLLNQVKTFCMHSPYSPPL